MGAPASVSDTTHDIKDSTPAVYTFPVTAKAARKSSRSDKSAWITEEAEMNSKLNRMTAVASANLTTLALLVLMAVGSSSAFAQTAVLDPALEVFRIRCQIDADIDPATGLTEPKVQIQGKARAELLDGLQVGIMVENISSALPPLPSVVTTVFELGSATADWDTFPDPGDLTPVTTIPGDFVLADESIKITAQVTSTGQTVSDIAQCVDKTGGQFRQDTKGVCTMKKFLRGKCKPGDILPGGGIQP